MRDTTQAALTEFMELLMEHGYTAHEGMAAGMVFCAMCIDRLSERAGYELDFNVGAFFDGYNLKRSIKVKEQQN